MKSPGSITVDVFRQAGELPAGWNGLLPASHFLRSEQLAIYERMKLPDVSFIYALVSVGDKIVAAAYFQVLQVRQYHLDTGKLKPLQAFAWKTFTGLYRPRLLVAGHLFRHDIDSFFCAEGFPPFETFGIYREAINKAMSLICAMAVLVKDMPATLDPYFQHHAPEYLLLRNDISMEMEINKDWSSVADYEKALKHKYAQRFRKIRQEWERLKIRELTTMEVAEQGTVLFGLYKKVSGNQPVRLGELSEDYLPALKKNNPEQLHIWLVSEGQQPVAFFSAWTHDSSFDMFYIGFDYSRNEELQLYFNILFFSVEQAITRRKSRLILGRTALEAKARLGCRPRYLSTFLFIRNRFLRRVVSGIQQKLIQEGEWENRHPFRPSK